MTVAMTKAKLQQRNGVAIGEYGEEISANHVMAEISAYRNGSL
jgi:hypothetical protein